MYQNGFLDGLIDTPVALVHLTGPQLEKYEHVEAVRVGHLAHEEQQSAVGYFRLDAYDEIGIRGAFTDSEGQRDSVPRFIPWGAVLCIS